MYTYLYVFSFAPNDRRCYIISVYCAQNYIIHVVINKLQKEKRGTELTMRKKRLVASLLAATLAVGGLSACSNDTPSVNTDAPVANSSNASDVYVIPEADKHEISQETQDAINTTRNHLETVRNHNALIKVIVGAGTDGITDTEDDDYILQIYNKDGQCYSEAANSAISFYYAKGQSVLFSTSVQEVKDITVLDMIDAAATLSEAGIDGVTVDVEKLSMTESEFYGETLPEESQTAEGLSDDTAEPDAEAASDAADTGVVEGTAVADGAVEDIEVLSPDERAAVAETNVGGSMDETGTETEPSSTESSTEAVTDEETEPMIEETIVTYTITGLDNIKKLYGLYSLEQANSVVDSWEAMYNASTEAESTEASDESTEAVDESTESTDGSTEATDTDETAAETEAETTVEETATEETTASVSVEEARESDKMIIDVYMTDTGAISAGCRLEIQGTQYTSWYFDGYIELDNWAAGDGWASGLTQDEYLDLITKVQDNLNASIEQWEIDHGYRTETEAADETTESTGESTDESTEETTSEATEETTASEVAEQTTEAETAEETTASETEAAD